MKHAMDGELWAIRAATFEWLRYRRQCPLVAFERSPYNALYDYRPDIIGVNRSRNVIEVEIKRTASDLRNNASKANSTPYAACWWSPIQFYFFVPLSLVEKARSAIGPADGLLTFSRARRGDCPLVQVIVSAKRRSDPLKVETRRLAQLVAHNTASLQRACVALALCNGNAEVTE